MARTRRLRILDRLFIALAAICLLRPALSETPRALGDAAEYLLMTESLYHHGSAALRGDDLDRLLHQQTSPSRIAGPLLSPLDSYVADTNGRAYSIHFWAYPLFCVPAKAFLRVLHGNDLKALQLTNAALLLLALVLLQRRGGETGRLLAALLLLSPATPFVLWPHPEVFSCSLVAIGLVLWSEGRGASATLATAVASLQAPPLVVLAALFWWQALRSRPRGTGALAPTLALLPAAWPFSFYLLHYGRLTILPQVGAIDLTRASLRRMGELFFDLNLGVLPYISAALFGACLAPFALMYLRRPVRPSLSLWAALAGMALLCGTTVNWNHGTAGPSRYVIWMLPIVFWLFVQMVDPALGKSRMRTGFGVLAAAALTSQGALLVARGGLNPSLDHLRHSYLAAFVLEHRPGLYNPSPEIFAERTLGLEVPHGAIPNRAPIVYGGARQCYKALIQKRHWSELLARCGPPPVAPDFSRLAASNQRGTWVYVDY